MCHQSDDIYVLKLADRQVCHPRSGKPSPRLHDLTRKWAASLAGGAAHPTAIPSMPSTTSKREHKYGMSSVRRRRSSASRIASSARGRSGGRRPRQRRCGCVGSLLGSSLGRHRSCGPRSRAARDDRADLVREEGRSGQAAHQDHQGHQVALAGRAGLRDTRSGERRPNRAGGCEAGARCGIPTTSRRATTRRPGGRAWQAGRRSRRGLPPSRRVVGLRQVDGMPHQAPADKIMAGHDGRRSARP